MNKDEKNYIAIAQEIKVRITRAVLNRLIYDDENDWSDCCISYKALPPSFEFSGAVISYNFFMYMYNNNIIMYVGMRNHSGELRHSYSTKYFYEHFYCDNRGMQV